MMRSRARSEGGQTTVEFISLLPLLVMMALIGVQVQIFVATANAAEGAARSAAIAHSEGNDPVAAARSSVDKGYRDRMVPGSVQVSGERVTVELRVPLISDAFAIQPWSVERSAVFDEAGSSSGDE